jgi:hypothetical protein
VIRPASVVVVVVVVLEVVIRPATVVVVVVVVLGVFTPASCDELHAARINPETPRAISARTLVRR